MIGRSIYELRTPWLVLDLERFERNVARMRRTIIDGSGVNWRPHVKSIRVPALAHKLIEAGAIGVTCATLDDAGIMLRSGIPEVLVTSAIASAEDAARLAGLARHGAVIIVVDCLEHVKLLGRAGTEVGVELPFVIEVDIGLGRAGMPPGERVAALAVEAARVPGVSFAGLMGWEGAKVASIVDPKEKACAITRAVERLVDSAEKCRAHGVDVRIVSCGGTGTHHVAARVPGVTEVQAGGGVFGDVYYRERYGLDHEFALTVVATVVSRPSATRVVCDAGWKSMGHHHAVPVPLDVSGYEAIALSAGHGTITLGSPSETPRLGDRIQFVVGYSDATVFLHDSLYGARDQRIEVVWPVPNR